jgi:ribosomal-protein-alanine N-acetyltransferase
VSAVLRDLTEQDLAWMAASERDIFGPSAWSAQLIRDDFAFGGKRYRGVEFHGELVAYAVYGYDGDAFHLMNLAVLPHARRRGLGRVIMEDLLAEARNLGAPDVWLEVAVTNHAAIALYRAYGFEDVRVRARYYQPENVDALVMRLRLPTPG